MRPHRKCRGFVPLYPEMDLMNMMNNEPTNWEETEKLELITEIRKNKTAVLSDGKPSMSILESYEEYYSENWLTSYLDEFDNDTLQAIEKLVWVADWQRSRVVITFNRGILLPVFKNPREVEICTTSAGKFKLVIDGSGLIDRY